MFEIELIEKTQVEMFISWTVLISWSNKKQNFIFFLKKNKVHVVLNFFR